MGKLSKNKLSYKRIKEQVPSISPSSIPNIVRVQR